MRIRLLVTGLLLLIGGKAQSQTTGVAVERPRWEFGQFEWVRDFGTNSEITRWVVGDSAVVSLKSLDDMVELVTRRRLPTQATQHTFFAWLGEQGWEMVSCVQADPADAVRRQWMTCWFKRRKP